MLFYHQDLTLFRMGLSELLMVEGKGWWGKKIPPSKVCYTYSAMMKVGRVIPYLKKVQIMYESRNKYLEEFF